MVFVSLGCFVLALIFLILSEFVRDDRKGDVFYGLSCAFVIGWIVCHLLSWFY